MNILINTNALRSALQDVIGVVSKELSMPILSHVLIEKNENRINITGTNLEMQITAKTAFLESDEFDPVTVSGRKLYEIVRSLDNQDIQITTTKNRLILKTNNSSFKLSMLPANNFPTFEDQKPLESFTINQEQLLDLLNKTSFSIASNPDVRFILCGLLLEITPNKLTAVATDAHRLAISSKQLDKKQINNISCIVPRRAVLELIRILQGDKEVKVSVGSNNIRVDFKGVNFISKLMDGQFPAGYKGVIPTAATIEILLEKQIIRSALQRVSILANEKFKGVRIEASNEAVVLSSENPKFPQEEAKETIEHHSGSMEQDKVIAGFNAGYLIEAINACSGEKIVIGINGANATVTTMVAAGGNGNYSVNERITKDRVVVGEVIAWSPPSRKLTTKNIDAKNQQGPPKLLVGDTLVGATSGASYTIEDTKGKTEGTLIFSPSDGNTKYVVMPYNF